MELTEKLLLLFFLCGAIYLVYRTMRKQTNHCAEDCTCKTNIKSCKTSKQNNLLKTLICQLLVISLFYLYATTPATALFANSIKNIDIDEIKHEIVNSNGKVMIIDFWATWCSPCKQQLSVLSRLYNQYESSGLSIIGVSLDHDKEKVAKFVNKQDIKYPVYFGNQDLAYSYNIKALPTTHIYDKDGNMVKSHTGFINEYEFKAIIENMLTIK